MIMVIINYYNMQYAAELSSDDFNTVVLGFINNLLNLMVY